MSKYDDIISIKYEGPKRHQRMSQANRAAQFNAFAALVGYDALIDEEGRITKEEIELNDDQAKDINSMLLYLLENREVNAIYTYFEKDQKKKGGSYNVSVGNIIKYREDKREIILNNKDVIELDNIISIDLE